MASKVLHERRPVIYVTNDDGISPKSALILPLARHLTAHGHDVVVCAPGKDNSACGQRITLSKSLTMRRHPNFEKQFRAQVGVHGKDPGTLSVFSVDEGTPSDCIICGVEPNTGLLAKLGLRPQLVLSGINVGQNLGNDVLYSGTFSAARQAAMYGIPSIAISLNFFSKEPNADKHKESVQNGLIAAERIVATALSVLPCELPDPFRQSNISGSLSGTINGSTSDETVPQKTSFDKGSQLIEAFAHGHVTLNVNVPSLQWDGSFTACKLDRILYFSAANIAVVPSGLPNTEDETFTFKFFGGGVNNLMSQGSDWEVIRRSQSASITPVSTWPTPHVSGLSDEFLTQVLKEPSPFWENTMNAIDGLSQT